MIEINLLPQELKLKTKKAGPEALTPNYLIYLVPLILGILICLHIFLAGLSIIKNLQLNTLNNKWQSLEPERKKLEVYKQEHELLSGDAKAIQQLTAQRILWAAKLNKLSLNLPSGIWFNELSLTQKEFVLRGSAISLEKQELNLINKFMNSLQNDRDFFKDFKSIDLSSIQRRIIGGYDIVDFVLSGALK